ncbi:MAG: hypothetical protein JSS20_13340 [Proteobacteria bacterium]|nr:hypothetical protein [Pseudomonadota bacterium]
MALRILTRMTVLASFAVLAAPVVAKILRLDDPPADKTEIQACEKRLCTMVLTKKREGEDLQCALGKTWPKEVVKYGAESASHGTWSMGDARCTVPFHLSRAMIAGAMLDPEATVQFPEHTVSCHVIVEEEIENVHVRLAPKIVFKNGEAKKVWVNVKKVDGPGNIKAMVWTAASLEDKLGLFHKRMLREINKLLHEKCPEKHGKG